MMLNYLFSILGIAGFAVLWRNILEDAPSLKNSITSRMPKPIRKALLCGFCFTYWISLAYVLLFDPLRGWMPPERTAATLPFSSAGTFFLSWMSVGVGASIIRFGYVAIQELVHYQVHGRSGEKDHAR